MPRPVPDVQDTPLFDGFEPPLPPPSVDPGLSADRRRTLRQAAQIRSGIHPLTGGPIHLLADIYARADDGRNLPYRCGSCVFRRVEKWHDTAYPKCWLPDPTAGADAPPSRIYTRVSHGAASDVRAWWPACRDYSPGDTSLSPDAARSLPGEVGA
ncbi:MAG TPA: hypothetical protein VFJ19_09670 [Nocardioidaceae bacterium]|nr:hypothetical protein [Nocardioidaceae bacterium]